MGGRGWKQERENQEAGDKERFKFGSIKSNHQVGKQSAHTVTSQNKIVYRCVI